MCVIVDANVAARVFTPTPDADFEPVWKAIFEGKIVAVHGGKLTAEYAKLTRVRRLVLELERAGKARLIARDRVEAVTEVFTQDDRCCSDDPHVLGLAQAANVRLLCSHDADLHTDFTNPQLLSPAGRVYQNSSHQHLLRQHCKRLRPAKKGRRTRRK